LIVGLTFLEPNNQTIQPSNHFEYKLSRNLFSLCKKNAMANSRSQYYLQELNNEYKATRACLEKIPESSFEFKPHPKSMTMGYLALLVAEIPLWVKYMVTDGEIDFVTFPHFKAKTTMQLVDHFEDNM